MRTFCGASISRTKIVSSISSGDTSTLKLSGRSLPLHLTFKRFLDCSKTPLFLIPAGVPTGTTGTRYLDSTSGKTTFQSTCFKMLVTGCFW